MVAIAAAEQRPPLASQGRKGVGDKKQAAWLRQRLNVSVVAEKSAHWSRLEINRADQREGCERERLQPRRRSGSV